MLQDGTPYTPKGAQKVGTTANESGNLSKDDLVSYGAQAKTGEPLNQIVPGYRQESTNLRQKVRAEAIRQIQEETGMTPAQAGEELALRAVNYGGAKRSVGQLDTMLGGTRQAVDQLDYNVKMVKEDLKQLPSTDLSPILNAIIRGEERWTGDPKYSSLFYHMYATATESARILAGGQASIAQLHQGAADEAKQWASVNMTPASFDDVAKSMMEEGQNRIQTYADAIRAQQPRGTTDLTKQPQPKGAATPPSGQQPPAGNFYKGAQPPPSHPEAKQGKDGRWYVPDGSGFRVLMNDAPAQPAAQPAAPAQPAQAGGSQAAPVKVTTPDEARALPPGTFFVGPDGVTRRRPMQPSAPTSE